MKITNKIKNHEISIEDLKGGEIFFRDGDFHLKLASDYCVYERLSSEKKEKMVDDIERTLDDWDDGEGVIAIIESYTNSYNAINLRTNELVYACGMAIPVEGELVITNTK